MVHKAGLNGFKFRLQFHEKLILFDDLVYSLDNLKIIRENRSLDDINVLSPEIRKSRIIFFNGMRVLIKICLFKFQLKSLSIVALGIDFFQEFSHGMG